VGKVEKLEDWFSERTFNHGRFADIEKLVAIKRDKGLKVSVCFPTMNVADTLGRILDMIRGELVEKYPLIDELAVIDSRSNDGTIEIAERGGARVIFDDEVLPETGTGKGKGEALWKSIAALEGDIICWIDSDIENMHPRFAYGLIGPLLEFDEVGYVKGFYDRPLNRDGVSKPSGGGRVTELTVRPVLNLFYPELSGMIQPLSGEYAGRRSVLEAIPFITGYGVETGMLIDILEKFGLDAFAQTDLEVRQHHNQPIDALGRMSFGILQALFRRLAASGKIELKADPGTVLRTFRREGEEELMVTTEIDLAERPPMLSVPGYRGAGG